MTLIMSRKDIYDYKYFSLLNMYAVNKIWE